MASLLALILALAVAVAVATQIALPTATQYKVSGLDKFGATDDMYSGLMPLDFKEDAEGAFFFWLAKRRANPARASEPRQLIIWLNGGPGCSSMVGMMWENGPFTLEFGEKGQKYHLKHNPYSWNEVADVVFVEQPLRTGFSPAREGAGQIRTEGQVGAHFRAFLLSFLQVFPEYKGVDIFLSGESYAGFYIPWIASAIVLNQLVETAPGTFARDVHVDGINLVGAAIGNGVLDSLHQEPSYAEYAYSHGLIPLAAKRKFDFLWTQCLEDIQQSGRRMTAGSFSKCRMMEQVLEAAGNPNEYNTATFVNYDRITSPGGPFDTFFQDAEVQEALHVRGRDLPGLVFTPEHAANISSRGSFGRYYEPPFGWKVCSDEISDAMENDHPVSAVPTLQFLVDFSAHKANEYDPPHISLPTRRKDAFVSKLQQVQGHLRVLLYSGEFDLNCNTLGTLHTLEANYWRQKAWHTAARSLWKFSGDVAGEYFTIDNIFSFLIVRNSGHLLPMDLPATALDMIERFVKNKSFADVALPSEKSYQIPDRLAAQAPYQTSNAVITLALVIIVAAAISLMSLVAKKGSSVNAAQPPSVSRRAAYQTLSPDDLAL